MYMQVLYQVILDLMTVKKGAVFVRKMGNLEQNMKKEFCYFCATVNPG